MDTTTRVGMPLADFIEASNTQAFELINGERVDKMPGVAGHNYLIHLVYQMIFAFLMQTKLGEVFMEATFVVPDAYDSNWVTGSRIPDILYFAMERITRYRQTHPDWREKPYLLVPDLVVEIVSPNDKVSELDAKIDAYLADGVRLVWVLDPQRRKAIVHAPERDQPLHLKGDAVLEGGDVLPGFSLPLVSVFSPS